MISLSEQYLFIEFICSYAVAVSMIISLKTLESTRANIYKSRSSIKLSFVKLSYSFFPSKSAGLCRFLAAELRNTISLVSFRWMTTPSSSELRSWSLPFLKISDSTKIIPILVIIMCMNRQFTHS